MPRQAHDWAGAFLPQPILCFSSRPSQWNPSEQFSVMKGPYHIDLLLNSFKGVGGSPPGCDRRRGWLASAVAAVNLLHLSEMDVRLGREEGARARGWGEAAPHRDTGYCEQQMGEPAAPGCFGQSLFAMTPPDAEIPACPRQGRTRHVGY